MKDWTEAFKEKLSDYRTPVPDDGLTIVKGIIHNNRKRRNIIACVSSTFAVAAALVSILIMVNHKGGEMKIDNEAPRDDYDNYYVGETQESEVSPIIKEVPLPGTGKLAAGKLAETVTESLSCDQVLCEPIEFQENKDSLPEEVSDVKKNINISKPLSDDSYPVMDFLEKTRNKQSVFRYFSVGLTAGNVPGSKTSFFPGLAIGGRDDLWPTQANPPANPDIYDPSLETFTYEYSHDSPKNASVGLSFSYFFTDRLAFSTGVFYYNCGSKVLVTSHYLDLVGQKVVEQKAHYLGIPLHIDWYPVRGNHFSMYFGVGGEMRKCLYAKRQDERLRDSKLYYSTIVLAGLKYCPVNHFGVFIEPQYSHSFLTNKPAVRTAFTDYSDFFTFKVGLSLDL